MTPPAAGAADRPRADGDARPAGDPPRDGGGLPGVPPLRGKDVTLEAVAVRFGGHTAVHPTDLSIRAGEFFSVLGPSGCGKTTLLRAVSGFVEPSGGRVSIGGEPMAGVGPNRRPTALIFQNLALFPLMSVRDNVAFGLECRGVGRRERRARADALLALVDLDGRGDAKPANLSGGQRQRVAVARALAVEPAVLLLDEPLSALDLKLRQRMRAELRAIQRRTGVTFVYITHDQGEALAMSDRVAVMRAGRIEQVDTADRVYAEPATPFVAAFVGETNRVPGRIVAAAGGRAVLETPLGRLAGRNRDGLGIGERVALFVRPERMTLDARGIDNALAARFERRDLEGPFATLVFVRDGLSLLVHAAAGAGGGAEAGDERTIGFAAEDGLILRDDGANDAR